MDSDSSLAILILAVFLLLFSAVSLVQGAFVILTQRGSLSWSESELPAPLPGRLLSHDVSIFVLLSLLRMAAILGMGLSLAAWVAAGAKWPLGVLVAVGLLILMALLQSLVRAAGQRYYWSVLTAAAPVLIGAYWTFKPLLWASQQLSSYIRQSAPQSPPASTGIHFGTQEQFEHSFLVEQELRQADPEERRMIRAILGLEEVSAQEIMVPRVDILAVDVNTTVEDVTKLMADGGHSRILVYRETIDNVVGIVHSRDVLQSVISNQENIGLAEIARPALFIPETKRLDQLLREFQEQRVTIAVVVDEYGGTEGLVTIEDLLEEIVGEIEDEFAREEPTVVRVNDKEVIVDGRVPLDQVNQLFQTSLEGDGFGTVGGLLSNHLGKIPVVGDAVDLEGVTVKVLSTTGRRVRKVRVVKRES